jgi:hypothetical protein
MFGVGQVIGGNEQHCCGDELGSDALHTSGPVQSLLSLQTNGGKVVTVPLTSRQVAPSQVLGCEQTPNEQQSMLQGLVSLQFGTCKTALLEANWEKGAPAQVLNDVDGNVNVASLPLSPGCTT